MSLRFRDLGDTNLPNLNSSTDKHVVKYNNTSQKLEIVSADSVISAASTSIPDDFVTQLESEIDAANLDFRGLDAGTF